MVNCVTIPYASGTYEYRCETGLYVVDSNHLKLIIEYKIKNNKNYAPATWKQICKVDPIKILKDTHQAFFDDQKFGHCHPIGIFLKPPEVKVPYLYTLGYIRSCCIEWDEKEIFVDLSVGDMITNMPIDWISQFFITVKGIV